MNIWRVDYDWVFASSSGMQRYTIDHQERGVLVATIGDSIRDVERHLQDGPNSQKESIRVLKCDWLGTVAPPLA